MHTSGYKKPELGLRRGIN